MSQSALLVALGGAAAAYAFFWALLQLTQEPKEPPAVLRGIPFFGPVLAMVRHGTNFYPHMSGSRKCFSHLPIYTLRIPGTRLYVVNSLHLIPMVQRQWRVISFHPVHVQAAKVAMGASEAAIAIFEKDRITDNGFVLGMVKAIHPTLGKGPALDNLTERAFEVLDQASQRIAQGPMTTVKLYEWIGAQTMLAATEAVYGPDNPMRDTTNLEAWSKFHPALMFILLDLVPQRIFFKRAIAARESLVREFANYFETGKYKQGSAYIQSFTKHCLDQQVPRKEIPRLILGTVFNSTANTVPVAFWVVFRVFSDANLRDACRAEIAEAVVDEVNATTLDLSYVLNSCPKLMSVYHEVFRFYGLANSVRMVMEDCLLDQHVLKKGGLVMISARAQHSNSAVWGQDVDIFDPARFVKAQSAPEKRFNPLAFRAFGGGTTLCPGRHFATNEVLMLVALLLSRFHIQPKGGTWVHPSTSKSSHAEAIEQPDNDIEVEMTPIAEANKKPWHVIFSAKTDPGT